MQQGELISIRPNLPCASSPIFLNGAAMKYPKWNTISISGYHIREAGSTAVQEIAFTLSNGKAYVKAALQKGLDINVFGKRLSFFFNAHNNLFEEVAKFRAARKMWAQIMKDPWCNRPESHDAALSYTNRRQYINGATTT